MLRRVCFIITYWTRVNVLDLEQQYSKSITYNTMVVMLAPTLLNFRAPPKAHLFQDAYRP